MDEGVMSAQALPSERFQFRGPMKTSKRVATPVVRKGIVRKWRHATALCFWIAGSCAPLYPAGTNTNVEQLSAEVIVEKLRAADLRRAEALRGYTGKRVYKVDYRGFSGDRHAEMVVEAAYTSPDWKEFRIVSQSGSKLLLRHVLLRLLDSEKEALQDANRQQTALRSENYTFTFLTIEQALEGRFYVLQVEPKIKNKFLYRGKIWIDEEDFAVARIEGEPAKNPSWWISSTQIYHRYTKIDGFWLPAHNESVTRVRLGGKAVLTIEYTDYKVKTAAATKFVPSSQTEPDPANRGCEHLDPAECASGRP